VESLNLLLLMMDSQTKRQIGKGSKLKLVLLFSCDGNYFVRDCCPKEGGNLDVVIVEDGV
jgi:hypothetical protein